MEKDKNIITEVDLMMSDKQFKSVLKMIEAIVRLAQSKEEALQEIGKLIATFESDKK